MTDLVNDAGSGSEDVVASEKPLSIRDSLKAAMDGADDSTPPAGAEKPRDETGRFVAKPTDQPTQPTAQAKPDAAAQPQAQPVTAQPGTSPVAASIATAPAMKAPPGWSTEAKASFDTLPDHVKAAITNREQEVDNGFKVLQDYKGLEEFTPYVKAANTTFAASMKRALDWEASLQRDPVNTVLHVARLGGVDIARLAAHLQQQPQPQQQPMQQAPQPRINVEETVEQVLRKRDVENQIQSFLSDPANVHAEAVMDDMAALIKTGRAASIKDAYDAACWMRPDIRQQLINQAAPAQGQDEQARRAAAADQARRASKSITGSSAPGPTVNAGAGKPSSIRDTLKEAMAAQGGRV